MTNKTVTEAPVLYVQDASKPGMEALFNVLANAIEIPFVYHVHPVKPNNEKAQTPSDVQQPTLPLGSAEQEQPLQAHARILRTQSVGELRAEVARLVGLDPGVCALQLQGGGELKDNNQCLNALEDLARPIHVYKRTPLLPSETWVPVYTMHGTDTTSLNHAMDLTIDDNTTADSVFEQAHVKWNAESQRIRHLLLKKSPGKLGSVLGTVCPGKATIRDALGTDLQDGCALVCQTLTRPPQHVANLGDVYVQAREWQPNTSALVGEPVELAITNDMGMTDIHTAIQTAVALRVGDRLFFGEDMHVNCSDGDAAEGGGGGGSGADASTGSTRKTGGAACSTDTDGSAVTTAESAGLGSVALCDVIKPWQYQLNDPSSLTFTNWQKPGFCKRASGTVSPGQHTHHLPQAANATNAPPPTAGHTCRHCGALLKGVARGIGRKLGTVPKGYCNATCFDEAGGNSAGTSDNDTDNDGEDVGLLGGGVARVAADETPATEGANNRSLWTLYVHFVVL